MKKYLLAIIFMLSFGTPFIGTYYFLKYQKNQVRKEIKNQLITGINLNELVHFRFSKIEVQTKLRWEHSKEFEFNGEMYDIVKSTIMGDTIYYWCWWDHKETKLNKLLKKLLIDNFWNNPLNKERQKRLDNFYQSLYFKELLHWQPIQHKDKQFKIFYLINYSNIFIIPPVPPPKIH